MAVYFSELIYFKSNRLGYSIWYSLCYPALNTDRVKIELQCLITMITNRIFPQIQLETRPTIWGGYHKSKNVKFLAPEADY